jgi:hypothetical protein
MHKLLVLLLVAFLTALAVPVAPARAMVLTFDDFPAGGYAFIGAEYAGFNWSSSWGWIDAHAPQNGLTGTGADLGTVSDPIVVFNANGSDVTVSRATPFTFQGAYFASFFLPNLNVTVTGYDATNDLVGQTVIGATNTAATYYAFNWSHVTRISFSTGHSGDYNYDFVMDNFTYGAAAPIPPSAILLAGGLFGLVALRRKFTM